jgi:PRC-barrel domain
MSDSSTSAPLPLSEANAWIGQGVDEVDGGGLGEVKGLFVDAESGEPTWLIVKLGRFGATLVAIPLRDCAAGGGRVWVAHARDAIRRAPVVDPTRPLLREHELTICAHFGIGKKVGRASEVASRPESSITSQPA